VPRRRRGAYFGQRSRISNFSVLVMSLVVAAVLPTDIANPRMQWTLLALFVFAAGCGVCEIFMYRGVREVPFQREPEHDWLAEHLEPLGNPDFRRFLYLGMAVVAGNAFVDPYLYAHCTDSLHLGSFKTLLILQSAPVLMVVLTGPFWGLCLDRFGRKATLAFTMWGATLASLCWVFVGPRTWWLGLLTAAVVRVFWAGVDLSFFNMILRWATGATRGGGGGAYTAVYNVGLAVAGLSAGYLSGELAVHLNAARWVADLQGWLRPWHVQFSPYLFLVLVGIALRFAAAGIFLPRVRREFPSPTFKNVRYLANHALTTLTQLAPRLDRD
jgi:MFS family permease